MRKISQNKVSRVILWSCFVLLLIVAALALRHFGNHSQRILADEFPIDFTVENGSAFNNCFGWTMSRYDSPALARDNVISVTYDNSTSSSNPSAGVFRISLPEDQSNRRFTHTVTARIGGVQMKRDVRVALNTYPGTPMPTTLDPTTGAQEPSTAALLTLHNWNTNPPVALNVHPKPRQLSWFDPNGYDPNDPAKDYYRLFYDPACQDYAMEFTNGLAGDAMRVYYVAVGPRPWNENFSTDVFDLVLNHEIRHLKQDVKIRDDNRSLEFEIDQFFKQADPSGGPDLAGYRDPLGLSFFEADACYQAEISNPNADFRWLDTGIALTLFVRDYNTLEGARRGRILTENVPLSGKVKAFQQNMYKGIAYPEMKRYQVLGGVPAYEPHIRAPE
jgi:hypothetical protein